MLIQSLDPGRAEPLPKRVVVTAAPPTANGDLHLGHLSGPYLAADVLTRYLKLRGVEAHFLCGTDEHFSYVPFAGAKLGLSGRQAADHYAQAIQETLQAAGIEIEMFVRPDEAPDYRPLVLELFERLHAAGKLIEKEAPHPYCERCELYLYEVHIAGRCPHCGAGAAGFCCEECGWPNDSDLEEATCTHCGGTPGARPFKRLYFPLSAYEKPLREYYSKVGMNTHLRSLVESLLAAGLPDMPVTHVADWGIPVPLPGYERQVLAVWFETAPRYLAYARQLGRRSGGDWERYFKDGEAQVVQCFGYDNGFLYGMYIPALLLAFDPDIRPPAAFVVNEFYHLEEKKFSTTRRHAIWGRDLLARVPADLVRFYLSHTRPETESTNFTLDEFAETIERELVGTWQPWLAELGARVAAEGDGLLPWTGDGLEEHRRFYAQLVELTAQAALAYSPRSFSPQLATRTLCELVRRARRFGKGEEHWRRVALRSEERRTGIALEVLAAKLLALLAAPILPDFAARLWHDLGYDTPLSQARWEERPTGLPGGQKLRGLGGPYFTSVRERVQALGQG